MSQKRKGKWKMQENEIVNVAMGTVESNQNFTTFFSIHIQIRFLPFHSLHLGLDSMPR